MIAKSLHINYTSTFKLTSINAEFALKIDNFLKSLKGRLLRSVAVTLVSSRVCVTLHCSIQKTEIENFS